jgi:RNA polymerase sigma factor (sigma-70 family)
VSESSGPLPITTSLLLSSLRDEQESGGWRDFHARYWPVLVGLGVHLGLRETDAQDAAQWTLLEFLKEFRAGRYERGKGRLRSYILGIARNRIRSLRRSASRPAQAARPMTDAHETPDDLTDAVLEAAWETERRSAILREAWEQLRASPKLAPATFLAFELVSMRGVPAEEAARQAGITVNDVYLARHRCTKRLKELVDAITSAWDEED